MTVVRRLLGPSIAVLRLAGSMVAAPITITAAALRSPQLARTDPTSRLLDDLRAQGWRPIEVRRARRRTEVLLERDVQQRTVTGETLAFAVYATMTGARAGTVIHPTA